MDRRHLSLIGLILFLFTIIAIIGNVNGYKWISLKSGDPLPENVVLIENSRKRYIGRAQHFDDILPAEIDENGIALVSSCGVEILKDEFEILTSPNECEWRKDAWSRRSETLFPVGKIFWNNESIFVGIADKETDYHIASFYSNDLTKISLWQGMESNMFTDWKFLCCAVKTHWVQSTAMKLPNNTVYGGKSKEGYDIFVARLKKDCDMIIGQAIPEIGMAKAYISNGNTLVAYNFEVLIGEPNEYTWIPVSNNEIPKHSVVLDNKYVVRYNKDIKKLSRSDLYNLNCEVLVKNVF